MRERAVGWGRDCSYGSARMSTRPENNWWTLVAVCGATFMLLVDITIVQVALPRSITTCDAGFTSLQWALDAYALSLASLLLTAGTLADRFGRKRVFTGGVAIFTLASLLCGIAGTGLELDLARALQGIGGAAMFHDRACADRSGLHRAGARHRDCVLGARRSAVESRSVRCSAARSPTGSGGAGSSSSTSRSAQP